MEGKTQCDGVFAGSPCLAAKDIDRDQANGRGDPVTIFPEVGKSLVPFLGKVHFYTVQNLQKRFGWDEVLTDYSGQYIFTMQCTQQPDATSHTNLECGVAPGGGVSLIFTANVCGQASVTRSTPYRYAQPVITSVTGPGADHASTAGGQLMTINGVNFGPANLIPSAVRQVSYSRGWTGIPYWLTRDRAKTTEPPGLASRRF